MNIDASTHRLYAALDQRLLVATRTINILPTVSWPASLERRMIEALRP